MSRMARILLTSLLLFSFRGFAENGETLLRFNAVSSGWPPYSFLDDKGNATGI